MTEWHPTTVPLLVTNETRDLANNCTKNTLLPAKLMLPVSCFSATLTFNIIMAIRYAISTRFLLKETLPSGSQEFYHRYPSLSVRHSIFLLKMVPSLYEQTGHAGSERDIFSCYICSHCVCVYQKVSCPFNKKFCRKLLSR